MVRRNIEGMVLTTKVEENPNDNKKTNKRKGNKLLRSFGLMKVDC